MAVSLSTNFVKLFEAEVKHANQAEQKLQGTCRTKSGVEGSTVQFPKIGAGQATITIPQTDVVPLNVTHSNVTATLSDYSAPEYSSIFDQQKVNYDERRELVKVVASAIGRRVDQIKLDALTASSTSLTVANSIGGSTTNLNFAKVREAKRLLDGKNVPAADRHMLIHADSLASLLSESQATSVDFVTARNLMDGSINSWMGFQMHMFGDMDEGGLAIAGSSDRSLFAFHKDSLGYAEGIGIKTEINYVPEKLSWLVVCVLSAGAISVDDSGIVKLTCRE